MNIHGFKIVLALAMAMGALMAMAQQPPPVVGPNLPDPGPNRVEVRFAIGTRPVLCKSFQITATAGGQTLLAGSFESGFLIPPAATANHDTFDLHINQIFDELVPSAERGPRSIDLGASIIESGQGVTLSTEFDKVLIRIYAYALPRVKYGKRPTISNEVVASLKWKNRTCQ